MHGNETYIVRFGPPNKYDHAPFGVICICKDSLGNTTKYLQTSKDENNPEWILLE